MSSGVGGEERFGRIGRDDSVDPSALRTWRGDGETVIDISEDIA